MPPHSPLTPLLTLVRLPHFFNHADVLVHHMLIFMTLSLPPHIHADTTSTAHSSQICLYSPSRRHGRRRMIMAVDSLAFLGTHAIIHTWFVESSIFYAHGRGYGVSHFSVCFLFDFANWLRLCKGAQDTAWAAQ
eukprot:RCo046429